MRFELWPRKNREQELEEEVRSHLEMAMKERVARGEEKREAERAARREFGNVGLVKEVTRDIWAWRWLEDLVEDVRFGSRMMRKSPGFTAVAVLTLALGIGANTAIFSVMNAVLLRFLPLPDPQRLVYLHWTTQPSGTSQTGHGDLSFSEPVFEELRKQRQVFSDVVGFVPLSGRSSPVRIGEEPEEAAVDMVSGNFFSGLGVQSVRGRILDLEDERRHTRVAILSYNYWTRRFARNPSTLGQTVYIKGFPFTIAGVAAREFAGVEPNGPTDLWIPFQSAPELKPWGTSPNDQNALYGSPNWWFLMMMGRLAPGANPQQALAQLQPAYERIAYLGTPGRQPNEQPSRLHFTSARGIEGLRQSFEEPLKILMVMVVLVLAIACGNVGMLLVARNSARQREFSLRAALGANGKRLFSQLLTESILLVIAGGSAGWFFAVWSSQALARLADLDADVAPDRTVLLFTLAISLVVAILFGLAPLRGAVRVPPGLAVRTSAASTNQTSSKLRAGQAVVALQMAFCLALLVGAGLLVRTLRNLETAPLGMRAEGLITFGITPPQSARTDSDVVRFFQSLLERLRILSGVESATILQNRPGSGWSNNTVVYVDGVLPREKISQSIIRWNAVGSNCFHVLGTPILLGRDFTDADSAATFKVAIVNESFTQRFLPGDNPLGRRISLDEAKATQYTIVGVVNNSKYTGVRERDFPMAYLPYTQVPDIASMQMELRIHGNPAVAFSAVQAAVRNFGPDLLLQRPMTQQAQFQASFSEVSLFARLAVFFSVLAALLVAIGLYGTLAYRVSRRTAEIGVRVALGAQAGQVLWMVLRESLIVSVAGILVGVPLALAGAKLLRSVLFGLTPGDPGVFSVAFIGIIVVAALASWLPARRAMRVDPMVALRYE